MTLRRILMPESCALLPGLAAALMAAAPVRAAQPAAAGHYGRKAAEVMEAIEQRLFLRDLDLYARDVDSREPDFMWGNGVMFSALVAAARHQPDLYQPKMRRFFRAMDAYWDSKSRVPGYEPARTSGNGNDKYYDDNAWMVLTFLEAHEWTGEAAYLRRAKETHAFVLSGWDDTLGGGIWWHEQHKDDSKNTCSNAPAAVSCFRLAKFLDRRAADDSVKRGAEIVEWVVATLQRSDALFADNKKVTGGKVNHAPLTYNTGLMIRAFLGRHAHSGNPADLAAAVRAGKAAAALLDARSGAYRDPPKWAHLLVEADLELYRKTGDKSWWERARRNADVHYERWQTRPPRDLLENASIARELWLLADHETTVGLNFWKKADRVR